MLYTATGVDGKKTTFIFSDTQIADETFTEIVNNLLSSGEVTNLFKPDEFEDVSELFFYTSSTLKRKNGEWACTSEFLRNYGCLPA